ncbi:MAG TPA: hypothetical protein VH419_08830 [Nocardioidaceae bacterium]
MSSALMVLAYDANDAKPGWIALIVVVLLGLATFLLWRSMNTQLRKISAPYQADLDAQRDQRDSNHEPRRDSDREARRDGTHELDPDHNPDPNHNPERNADPTDPTRDVEP